MSEERAISRGGPATRRTIPADWFQLIRDEMPAFDPSLTPTRGTGAIVECFRHFPGARRSSHPTVSFAALGPHAGGLVGMAPSLLMRQRELVDFATEWFTRNRQGA
jgi:aminoglycoside N3'-acetyltransferase